MIYLIILRCLKEKDENKNLGNFLNILKQFPFTKRTLRNSPKENRNLSDPFQPK